LARKTLPAVAFGGCVGFQQYQDLWRASADALPGSAALHYALPRTSQNVPLPFWRINVPAYLVIGWIWWRFVSWRHMIFMARVSLPPFATWTGFPAATTAPAAVYHYPC
jgi:hypothetical protein